MDNKSLIDTMSKNLDISRDTVASLIEEVAKAIGDCCSQLDSVSIQGFGTFEGRKRMERMAVHPASGKRLLVPPKVVVAFKASQGLKQRINNETEN